MKINVKAISLPRSGGSHDLQFANQDLETIEKFLAKNEFKELSIVLNTDVLSRSEAQNRFFHSVIVPTFQRTLRLLGMPGWQSREFIKEKILKAPFLTVKEFDKEYVRGTSSLSVREMWQFITSCLQLLTEIGGDLDAAGMVEFQKIVRDYNLEKGMEDAAERIV